VPLLLHTCSCLCTHVQVLTYSCLSSAPLQITISTHQLCDCKDVAAELVVAQRISDHIIVIGTLRGDNLTRVLFGATPPARCISLGRRGRISCAAAVVAGWINKH
jgi:hypothetical protein